MIPDPGAAIRFAADHLWQSTLTACIAAGLVWTLRSSEARLRHAAWMIASLKFLLPFALLEQVGARLMTQHVFQTSNNPVITTVLTVGQPFAAAPSTLHAHGPGSTQVPWLLLIALVWATGSAVVLITWLVRTMRVRAMVRRAVPQHDGREAETLRVMTALAGIRKTVPLLLSKDCMEPGIYGIFRPALVWPEGISARLDDSQVAAIVAHEVWHVRRRDNLLALLHMCVEAAFWFHPLVWWMGARLIEERERACDEAVLQMGNEPGRYAEAILNACRFCVESPLPCVSGVSGSDLKRRMVRIMNAATVPLSWSRKMLLATVATAVIAGPIVLGALHPRVVKADEAQDPQLSNLHFTSASLTPASTDKSLVVMQNDRQFTHSSITMKDLIAMAYGVKPERIVGGPDWIDTQRFDFDAHWTPTPESGWKEPASPNERRIERHVSMTSTAIAGPGHETRIVAFRVPAPVQAMLRNFLAERVNLKLRNDSAVLPVYELRVTDSSRLTPVTAPTEQPAEGRSEFKVRVEERNHDGTQSFWMTNVEMRLLCENLSQQLGHEVIDKTGLTGRYQFEISRVEHSDPDQLAALLREKYGLDLQSTQLPVKVFDVSNIDMPQEK